MTKASPKRLAMKAASVLAGDKSALPPKDESISMSFGR
jgi:hypothetical protein